jgi:uncharacterized membrane protein YhaH (DUF805 family)
MNLFNLLFSFDGRIGRSAYAGGWLLNFVVMLAAMGFLIYLRLYWTLPEPFNLKDGSLLSLTLITVIAALFHVVQLAVAAKRLHDLGITGWFSLPMITPGPNLIMAVVLMILHGEDKDNRYGPGTPSTRAPAPAHHA